MISENQLSEKEVATEVPIGQYEKIDHVAIAVKDFEAGISFFKSLGFSEENRLVTTSKENSMVSCVMSCSGFSIVILKGTSPESQVSKFVAEYGPGVQHIAFKTKNIAAITDNLAADGLKFSTDVVSGPGLSQRFSLRDKNSGVMIEFIERFGSKGFQSQNVNELFQQLEKSKEY